MPVFIDAHGNALTDPCTVRVNTVNCDGFMGKGIALGFKKRYHENFVVYKEMCNEGEVRPGLPYATIGNKPDNVTIINFPTKNGWRYPSRIEWIEYGLRFMKKYIHESDTVLVPLLGAANGGLEPTMIINAISTICKDWDAKIIICLNWSEYECSTNPS